MLGGLAAPLLVAHAMAAPSAPQDIPQNQTMERNVVKTLDTEVTIAVKHVKVVVNRPFEAVRDSFQAILPPLNTTGLARLRAGDVDGGRKALEALPELSIFQIRDHGDVLRIAGLNRQALQYDIGNPYTASRMTRHQLAAAQYAPFRVVLYEDAEGRAVFEYDKPSSLFGQFGDPAVTRVGDELDLAIERAIRQAD
jgi:uncharacterized protein (DUF302 family)